MYFYRLLDPDLKAQPSHFKQNYLLNKLLFPEETQVGNNNTELPRATGIVLFLSLRCKFSFDDTQISFVFYEKSLLAKHAFWQIVYTSVHFLSLFSI